MDVGVSGRDADDSRVGGWAICAKGWGLGAELATKLTIIQAGRFISLMRSWADGTTVVPTRVARVLATGLPALVGRVARVAGFAGAWAGLTGLCGRCADECVRLLVPEQAALRCNTTPSASVQRWTISAHALLKKSQERMNLVDQS